MAAVNVTPAAAQNPCAAPVTNPVACENTQPGATDWEVDGAGDPSIQGFATAITLKPGDTVGFKIKSDTPNFKIDVLRLGWYGGDGARKLAEDLTPTGPSTQPSCVTSSTTGLIDCGNWSTTRSWTVPSNAVSGVYIAHLKRNDGNGDSQITFVVRNEASTSDVVVQTSDATWQAYNDYGGNSLYKCEVACPPGNPLTYKAAYDVSYNRPFNTAVSSRDSWLMTGAEYPLIRWLERNGYNVSYLSSVDVHRRPALIRNHDLFISSGHDEYWSTTQRSAMEAARDAGVNLAFLTGNEGYWKTRWKPSGDGTNTLDRTITSYKDTHFNAQEDPVEWTGTWTDPRYTSAAQVTPQNALTGQLFVVNSGTTDITVPYQYRQLRMWRNTAVANLNSGQSLTLAPNTLGYEWDVDADNGFRPRGQFRLSSTTASGLEVFTDYGSTTQFDQTATHNLTMYRAPSGARVFGAGTVQWAFGLDDFNSQASENTTMQQATVNLFADMGAQPATRQSGLSSASASSDNTAPTSSVTSPSGTVQDGANVTISGTASDSGGVVAGVEVSTDGGTTWHPANGTTSWTYSWKAHGNPSVNIRSRAADDSGNVQNPGAGVTVNVSCPCSIWGANVAPPQSDGNDGQAIEVGVKFRTESYGQITGVRFYKSAANTGTHSGSLWTTGGQRLAQATFTNETGSGWQSVSFSQPVVVQPGTTYIASYHAPQGHYAATADYFHRAPAPLPQGGAIVDSKPLHALLNNESGGNGVYNYGTDSSFPANSFNAANYWVDVAFSPLPAPGTVTGVTATAGGPTSANVSWTAPSSGGPPTSYEVTPYIGSTAQATRTVTGSPLETRARITGLTTGTTYAFRVRAVNPAGAGALSSASGSVTPLTIVAPTAPTDLLARPGSSSARLTWSAPYSNGESAITAYRITPYIAGQAQPVVEVGPSDTAATVTGLTNGTSHTFTVAAKNAAGTGPASAASNAVTPQATIFDFATPAIPDGGDPDAIEVGVKFRSDVAGQVTGVRFYKAATNTGTHTGSLWTLGGQRLAQVTFSGETASGWQAANFSAPVNITANTTYVVSYFAPSGHYSVTGAAFATGGVDNPPLHALNSNADNNGVYVYSATSAFPFKTYNAANYFVDAMFAVPSPGTVTGVSAVGGSESATVSWSAPSSGGPVTSYRITPFIGSIAQTPTVVTGSPLETSKRVMGLTQGTSYTFKVAALNANGAGPASALSNAVTPTGPSAPAAPTNVVARPASHQARVTWNEPTDNGGRALAGYTLTPYVGAQAQTPVQVGPTATATTVTGLDNGTAYTFKLKATNSIGTGPESAASAAVTPRATLFDFTTPGTEDAGDPSSVELGVKFRSSVVGDVTGVRFYKSTANTGTHTGSLWTLGGQRLAEVTFSGETASGWQAATFSAPVRITANTTYVVSYFAPNGHYAVTGGAFASGPLDNPPLSALANDGNNNGVYAYGSASSFPSNNFNAANYWVDVLFATEGPPAAPTGVTATAGPASAELSWSAPGGGPVTSYEVTPYIGSTAQTPVTVSGSPPATAKVVSGLTAGTSYRFTVRATGPGGQGPASALSNAVTPTAAGVPSAPTGVLARPASSSARVSWTEPANDGGGALTGYTVTPYIGANAQTPVTVSGSTTATTVAGLANGTAYGFTVKATNSNGSGPASTASAPVTPQATIFDFATPEVVDGEDGGSINLGLKFSSQTAGAVTGVRFYKAPTNTGTHVGQLWSGGGSLLGEATFAGESASGWQTATFAEPVAITADTTYVVSYFAPNGHYSFTPAAFATVGVDNPPLHALANGLSNNGVYGYSGSPTLPSNNFNATNYWVDVLVAPSP